MSAQLANEYTEIMPQVIRGALMCGILFVGAAHTNATPWTSLEDVGLRCDIQNLVDAGVINTPAMTWPMSWANIESSLSTETLERSNESIKSAYRRVRRVMGVESQRGLAAQVDVMASSSEAFLRPYGARGFDNGRVGGRVKWLGSQYAAELHAAWRGDSQDGDEWVADGSYVAGVFGNWITSFGREAHWWGPGWRNSLIWGTHARPLTALSLRRHVAERPAWPLFRWLGPWHFETHMAQLDHDPLYDRPLLWGARFTFLPHPDLELGVSRTAMWGGEGRDEDLRTFGKILIGKDNDAASGEQVSNQLGGFDVRWRSPLGQAGYAVYAQYIGEDEAGVMPAKYAGLAGVEVFDWLWLTNYPVRTFFEVEDTRAGVLSQSGRDPNVFYEHSVYQAGYRYRGRSIGSGLDNDSLTWSLGVITRDRSEMLYQFNASWLSLNQDGAESQAPSALRISRENVSATLLEMAVSHDSPRTGWWTLGGSWQSEAFEMNSDMDDRYRVFVAWTIR